MQNKKPQKVLWRHPTTKKTHIVELSEDGTQVRWTPSPRSSISTDRWLTREDVQRLSEFVDLAGIVTTSLQLLGGIPEEKGALKKRGQLLYARYLAQEHLVELQAATLKDIAALVPEKYNGPSIQVWDQDGYLVGWVRRHKNWKRNGQ